MESFEMLGAFYLGKGYDLEAGAVRDELYLYDAKDLTTHAVCVGMTGSGKTGLCLSLLEEAAIDRIPAIAIDPKGDLGNLLLTFPGLGADDFRPWIDEGEASRNGFTPDDYAKQVAKKWREGLASWGQNGERIARLRAAADIAIYTPGSSAGLPISVLQSFHAPPRKLLDDPDAVRERTSATVSGLLTLLGIDADPLRSREHILLSTLLDAAWKEGKNLDLAAMIREIQEPPFDRIGVIDVESFFPAKDRFTLAMTLNNLLASPGFAPWMNGEPLDVARLLHTPEGKPRISILSIAHLGDAERMFFVTLLLNEVVSWMRTQSGSTSLRALLYMDEVFGYLPPTANPPSKLPMLTLLKQARAFGLGVVLATQNPVDLDYKGLSNAGTWFLGRLQTERDKARVLDGLEGISSTSGASQFDRSMIEATLARLKSRVFLVNNVHEDELSLFHTRWALSYLRGPLTRAQIRLLSDPRKGRVDSERTDSQRAPIAEAQGRTGRTRAAETRPVVPPGIREGFVTPSEPIGDGEGLLYRPALLGRARLHYINARVKIDSWEETALLTPLPAGDVGSDPWAEATDLPERLEDLDPVPIAGAIFAEMPPEATRPKSYARWSKALASHLYRECTMTLWKCPELKAVSRPEETEGDFRARTEQNAREKRDLSVEKLRKRYGPKLQRLQERIRKAQQKVEREQSQYKQQKVQTAISVGATLLGALFGRKVASAGNVGRATTSMRGMGRVAREKGDIAAARENLREMKKRLDELEQDFTREAEELRGAFDPESFEIETKEIRSRKSDISVGDLWLVWMPWRKRADGIAEPAFRE